MWNRQGAVCGGRRVDNEWSKAKGNNNNNNNNNIAQSRGKSNAKMEEKRK
jgi:hypothetical protein